MTKMRICKQLCLFVAAWLVLSAAMSGCSCVVRTYNVSKPDTILVKTAPPSPQSETVPSRPSAKHIWRAGAWEWNDGTNSWKWTGGAWIIPPDGYIWVDATYEAQGDGAVIYTPGHWEDDPSRKPALTGKSDGRR